MAVKEGRTDIVSLLLEAGADTDIQKKVLQCSIHMYTQPIFCIVLGKAYESGSTHAGIKGR